MFEYKWEVVQPGNKSLVKSSIVEASVALWGPKGSLTRLVLGIEPERGSFRWYVAHRRGGDEAQCSYVDTGSRVTFTEAMEAASKSATVVIDLMRAAVFHDRENGAGRDE